MGFASPAGKILIPGGVSGVCEGIAQLERERLAWRWHGSGGRMCVHPSGEGRCVQKDQSLAFLQGFRKRVWFLNPFHLQ